MLRIPLQKDGKHICWFRSPVFSLNTGKSGKADSLKCLLKVSETVLVGGRMYCRGVDKSAACMYAAAPHINQSME